ncbi:uncharacterized protein [Antedon mediterranea]
MGNLWSRGGASSKDAKVKSRENKFSEEPIYKLPEEPEPAIPQEAQNEESQEGTVQSEIAVTPPPRDRNTEQDQSANVIEENTSDNETNSSCGEGKNTKNLNKQTEAGCVESTAQCPSGSSTGKAGTATDFLMRSLDEKLGDMPESVLSKMTMTLDMTDPGGKNWQVIGDHFNVEKMCIRRWEDKSETSAVLFSPSKAMIRHLAITENRDLTVGEWLEACIVCGRFDVVRVINKYYVK